MALPEALCSLLMIGGNHVPFADSLGAMIVLGGVLLSFLIRFLPIATELVPVVGAFLAGVELQKHTLVLLLAVYMIVSILTVTGRLPFCPLPA